MTAQKESYDRLIGCGLRPSVQRLVIMDYLLTHNTHPTVEDVYKDLCVKIPTLSRTTVYNTLRLFSEQHAAQMLTIDEHRVCYDGETIPHVHFLCRRCGKIYDLKDVLAPEITDGVCIENHVIDEVQLYCKGVCGACLREIN